MTVTTTATAITYTANGAQRTYAYPFKVQDAEDIVVLVGGVPELGFSVAGVGDDAGGSITLTTPPAAGSSIAISRNVIPLKQTTDLITFGKNKIRAIEDALDRQVMAFQEYSGGGSTTVINITDPGVGAVADNGVTDNAPIIQAAINTAHDAGGGVVYVPSGNGNFYGVNSPFILRSYVHLVGDGWASCIKNTGTALKATDRVMHVGTYSGFANPGDMHDEVSYDVADYVASTGRTLTFLNAGDGDDFDVGQLVMIEDQRTYDVSGNQYPTDTFAARVLKKDANTITVDRTIPINLTAVGGSKPTVYALNTDNVVNQILTDELGYTVTAFCAELAAVTNLRFETTNTFWQSVIGISGAYECLFSRLWINGSTGMPFGNPINHCTFRDIWCEYGRLGQEMGYSSGDNKLFNVNWKRTSDADEAPESIGVRENWDGGGRNEYYGCHVDDEREFTNGGLTVLMAKYGTRWFGGSVRGVNAPGDLHSAFQISRGVAGEALADDFVLDGAIIFGANAHGVSCAADRAIIKNNAIQKIDGAFNAITLSTASHNCIVKDNRLGGPGESGSQYTVDDVSNGANGHRIYDNLEPDNDKIQSYNSVQSTVMPTDTAENTAYEYTVPADVIRRSDAMEWDVLFNIGGTGAGTKTVRFYLNSEQVMEYVFTAAHGTTVTPVHFKVRHTAYDDANAWVTTGLVFGNDNNFSGNDIVGGGGYFHTPGEPFNAPITFKVTVQLQDAADAVQKIQGLLRPARQRALINHGLQA